MLVAGVSAYLTLTLIIKSEDTVVVPELVGKNVVNVLELLTNLGLNTKIKGSEYNAEVPKNHIIFQEPEPGAEIKKGRDVRIILSKGPKAILVPNLQGLSLQQARIILEENGLCREIISITYSNDIKKDEIITQFPSPGTMITRGECVNMLASKGIRTRIYKMPDLQGLYLDEAIPLIEDSGLVLGEIKSFSYKGKLLETIVDHEPLSGHPVAEKSIVNLVINREPGQRGRKHLHGKKTGLFRYRIKDGFLKRHIRVRIDTQNFSNDLFDGLMKPGEELWLLIPQNKSATVFLYEDGEIVESRVYGVW
jgi:serine/threonine-protein kinase